VLAHILLIDDDEIMIGRVQPALAREGYRVNCAAPGLEAIRRMLLDEPDLVILGIDPPHHGWGFCHQLLTFVEMPLLLLLAGDDEQDRIKGLKLGADDCMAKPAPLGELLARVQSLLRQRQWAGSQ
jgi:DNA-binding response OmpR family regulator